MLLFACVGCLLLLTEAEARITRCDLLMPVTFSAVTGDSYLTMATTLRNIQIGSRPGLLGSESLPISLIESGATIWVPQTGAETSYFMTNTTDLFYAGCRRQQYPAVSRTLDTAVPLVPVEALFAMAPAFTWSHALRRANWADLGWQQYFMDRPTSYCVHRHCSNPFICSFTGTVNETRSIEMQLTSVRAGIGLSSDLYAAGGCSRLVVGHLHLNVCVDQPAVCRGLHCRAPVYELAGALTNFVLVGLDPLLPNRDLGLVLHWRPEEACGIIGQAWDETAHLLPTSTHWMWFIVLFVVWVVVHARPSVDDIILLLQGVLGKRPPGTQKGLRGVIRLVPFIGGSLALAALVWIVWVGKPSLLERAQRATIDLPDSAVLATPWLATIGGIFFYLGLIMSSWAGSVSRVALELYYTPLLLTCFQTLFSGGSVNDYSTYLGFAVAIVGIAVCGRNIWAGLLGSIAPWQMYVAAPGWLLYLALDCIIGLYPAVGTFDQLDDEHTLATMVVAFASLLIYYNKEYTRYQSSHGGQ